MSSATEINITATESVGHAGRTIDTTASTSEITTNRVKVFILR